MTSSIRPQARHEGPHMTSVSPHRDPGLLWLPSQGKENQGSEMRSSLLKLRDMENYPEIQGKSSDCSSPVLLVASQLPVTGLSSGSTSIFVEIILERIFCFIEYTTFGDVAGWLRVAWIPLLKNLIIDQGLPLCLPQWTPIGLELWLR